MVYNKNIYIYICKITCQILNINRFTHILFCTKNNDRLDVMTSIVFSKCIKTCSVIFYDIKILSDLFI